MKKIDPTAKISEDAVIGEDVEIGPYCVIGPKVEIKSKTSVGPYCMIQGPTVIGSSCNIIGHASIGTPPQDLKYKGEDTKLEIGDSNTIREFVTINRGTPHGGGLTKIGSNNLLMAYCHVAHDCQVGSYVVMGNVATLAGHVQVGDRVIMGGLCAVHQFTRIGSYAIVGGGSMVNLDVIPYVRASGDRVSLFGINTIGLKRNGFSDESMKKITKAYKILFQQKKLLKDALKILEEDFAGVEEVSVMIDFIKSSERGIAR